MSDKTQILPASKENIEWAAAQLRAGELIAIPTETVYGLAADGLNAEAVLKIFSAKARPHFDPLILHLPPSWSQKLMSCGLIDENQMSLALRKVIQKLIDEFWPGPLTLILPKSKPVPDQATSGLNTVAVRIPEHPIAQALLESFGGPLAAPSANRFGRISPTSASEVLSELEGKLPAILDGGRCSIGLESTVIHPFETQGEIKIQILRPGKISPEQIQTLTQCTVQNAPHHLERIQAPGQLQSHYSPITRLILLNDSFQKSTQKVQDFLSTNPQLPVALLFYSSENQKAFPRHWGNSAKSLTALSKAGDPQEAAFHLFSRLRELDSLHFGAIIAEPPPHTEGLNHAIFDRLKRAAHETL